jgi:catechol 2,3-dioxygenase-like lactoylglutathione lyase family enzyme
MQITDSALSLNVPDVAASATFLKQYFGFHEVMAAEGFVSLKREDVGFNLIFLRLGLASIQPRRLLTQQAQGLIVAWVVNNIDQEYAQLQQQGVPILTPIETEPWGERYFQVEDPNGVIYQLVQWIT